MSLVSSVSIHCDCGRMPVFVLSCFNELIYQKGWELPGGLHILTSILDRDGDNFLLVAWTLEFQKKNNNSVTPRKKYQISNDIPVVCNWLATSPYVSRYYWCVCQ